MDEKANWEKAYLKEMRAREKIDEEEFGKEMEW